MRAFIGGGVIVDARVRACVKAAFEEREGRSEEIEGSVVQFFVEARSEFCRNFCSRLFANEKKKKLHPVSPSPNRPHLPPFPPCSLSVAANKTMASILAPGGLLVVPAGDRAVQCLPSSAAAPSLNKNRTGCSARRSSRAASSASSPQARLSGRVSPQQQR